MAKDSPPYEGLKNILQARIDSGELQDGAQLPSESELIDEFGLSRHQVREALRELEFEGYIERVHGRGSFVAPRTARSMGFRFGPSRAVALCFPQYASLYARQIVEGFMQHMSNAGRQVVAYNVQYDNNSEYEFLQNVRDSGVEGFAIWLGHMNDRAHGLLEGLIRGRFPLLLMDRYFADLDTDCVASDNEDIGYRLTRTLLDRGHERISFVTTDDLCLSSVSERQSGYLRAMKEAGRPADDIATVFVGYDEDGCRIPVAETMARLHRPTAFCCVNDLIAGIFSRQLAGFGFTIGRELEVASLDDDHVSEKAGIPMIRLVQPAYSIGVRSAEFLLNRIAKPDRPVQRAFLKAGPVVVDGEEAGEDAPVPGGEKGEESALTSASTRSPAL